MTRARALTLIVGLALFVLLGSLAGAMATGAASIKPLALLWLFTPAPLVFLAAYLRRPQSRPLRTGGSAYLATGAALTVLALAGGGWHFSNTLRADALTPQRDSPQYDLEVVGLEQGTVTLRATPQSSPDGAWTKDGIWGLEWEGGYTQVGAIRSLRDREVVRELLPMGGVPAIGARVHMDSFAFPGDPRQAFGLDFEEVSFSSPLGTMPAWSLPGTEDTWVIFVHGRGATRREALRLLPTMAALGLPSLVITYRNDEEAPASPTGRYDFGLTEWEDLEGAVRYAIEHGARDVVLVGYSMGGGIVTSFLYRSPLAERVDSVVLDAPMLVFGATIDLAAHRRNIPGPLTTTAKTLARLRFGVDWEALDYLKDAERLTAPILLFHGDDDPTVPIATSEALAKSRPDLVTYVRVPGATHVRSWSMDPASYDRAVGDFLKGVPR